MEGPFALILRQGNSEIIQCLNAAAEIRGLCAGQRLADARSFCPSLITAPATPTTPFLRSLRRWAERFCPWVGLDGEDGLILDITGSAHLFGGEAGLRAQISAGLTRAGLSHQLAAASTKGAAWALAHFAPDAPQEALLSLPVAALRLPPETALGLQRLGLRRISDLASAPRAPLARRFGPTLLLRLDQALGAAPEPVSPEAAPAHFATRMTLPEPIGLVSDVMAATERLLTPLCAKLLAHEQGARRLTLTLRRVDQASQAVELRLAAPLRDPARILPLFARGIETVEAGFGIDQMRLEATLVEPLAPEQLGQNRDAPERLTDLITRIGTRIGLDNIQRFLPAESPIPERSFLIAPAAYSTAQSGFVAPRPRPIRIFAPEPIWGESPQPPERFRWRGMRLTLGRATGPERIAREWWLPDPNWASGLRDYWKVDTREGRRLWLFYTPQNPSWFVQGEFA